MRPVFAGIVLFAVSTLQAQSVQNLRAGYAIVTPVSANQAGLIALETLSFRSFSGTVQAEFPPAAVLTTVALPVDLGLRSEGTTALAIVNRTAAAGNVHLSVTDQQGTEILSQTLSVLPQAQFSRFLTEIFAGQINANTARSGLLTVTSDVPVALTAVNFRDGAFANLPIMSLASPQAVPLTTPTPSTTSTGSITATATTGAAPIAFPTVTVMPVLPIVPSITTQITSPVTTATQPAIVSSTVGGAGAFIFSQVANTGGWATQIRVANTSSAPQTVRFDVFDPNGVLLSTQTNITIPSRGLYNFVP